MPQILPKIIGFPDWIVKARGIHMKWLEFDRQLEYYYG